MKGKVSSMQSEFEKLKKERDAQEKALLKCREVKERLKRFKEVIQKLKEIEEKVKSDGVV